VKPANRWQVFIARKVSAQIAGQQFSQTIWTLGQDDAAQPEDWRDPAATQRKTRAAAIRCEIAARADELRSRGVRNPVTQAEEEIAKRWQRTGPALNRWLRRNR
jgi:hypothetical protein